MVGIVLTLQATLSSTSHHSSCELFILPLWYTIPNIIRYTLTSGIIHFISLLPLIFTFSGTIYFSHKAYKIDEYHEIPTNPDRLFEYLEDEVVDTKIAIYHRMRNSFNENEAKIRKKVSCINYAFMYLGGEVVIFMLALLYRSLC